PPSNMCAKATKWRKNSPDTARAARPLPMGGPTRLSRMTRFRTTAVSCLTGVLRFHSIPFRQLSPGGVVVSPPGASTTSAAVREIKGVMRTEMPAVKGGTECRSEARASLSSGRPSRNPELDMSCQTTPPLPLSIGWRGGQGERSCTSGGLTPVPPLHSMERGPGGEAECAHPRKVCAKKQKFRMYSSARRCDIRALLVANLLAQVTVASAGAESLLLTGATVHTVSGETLLPGQVLVENGKIAAVGKTLSS